MYLCWFIERPLNSKMPLLIPDSRYVECFVCYLCILIFKWCVVEMSIDRFCWKFSHEMNKHLNYKINTGFLLKYTICTNSNGSRQYACMGMSQWNCYQKLIGASRYFQKVNKRWIFSKGIIVYPTAHVSLGRAMEHTSFYQRCVCQTILDLAELI